MEQCRQFKHLLNGVKKYTQDVRFPNENNKCFATGTINGYIFRLFQELNVDNKNGTDDKYGAYLCIKDENADGSKWPAFYNEEEIDEWFNKKISK